MHSQRDRIYRLAMHNDDGNYQREWARFNRSWINYMKEDMAEVEEFIRFQNYYPRDFGRGEDTYKIPFAYSVDAGVFRVFDFELLRGNPETALTEPFSIVLTETIAQRIFGDEDPMGKRLKTPQAMGEKLQTYRVTGIMKDLPSNTHLPVNLFTSFASPEERQGWAYIYILLKPQAKIASVEAKTEAFIQKRGGDDEHKTLDIAYQALASIHLDSDLSREIVPNGKRSRVYLFAAVGIFIFLMSAINFVNLNVAQAFQRQREMGVRKLLGSSARNLMAYFLIQAQMVTFLAAILGMVFLFLFLPYFKAFTPVAQSPWFMLPMALGLSLLTGLLAGYFPGLMFSGAGSLQALKGRSNPASSRKGNGMKNVLVSVQLILCIVLISSAYITQSQFSYLIHKNLGFDREHVLALTNLPQAVKEKREFIKEQLLHLSGVSQVSASMEVPSREIKDMGPIYAEGMSQAPDNKPVMDAQVVDQDFLALMDIELLAGRNFRKRPVYDIEKDFGGDAYKYFEDSPREYILNETAANMLGWHSPEEALGKSFSWSISDIQLKRGPVIGVIQDYHQESLKNAIKPVVYFIEPMWLGNTLIKVKGDQIPETLAQVQGIWKEQFPEYTMEFAFLDSLYHKLYETERKQLQLIYIFSGLAILIAFMGIFGILSYVLKSREKEIAIRKVLGANLTSLAVLLSRKFVYLTLMGMALAVPLTWYAMEAWLQNFEYRISIQGFNFALALLVIFGVLFLTVALQMQKVARQNPVNTLRAE